MNAPLDREEPKIEDPHAEAYGPSDDELVKAHLRARAKVEACEALLLAALEELHRYSFLSPAASD